MVRTIVLACIVASNAVVLAAADGSGVVSESEEGAKANPIRRVVALLQGMSKKIEAEGQKATKVQDDYRCYCKKNIAEIAQTISNHEAKVPELESGIQESTSKLSQLKADVKAQEEDLAEAKSSLESAVQQREVANKAYLVEADGYKSLLGTLGSAIPAIEKGMSSSLLQTNGMRTGLLTAVQNSLLLSEYQRADVTAFLTGGRTEEVAPGSSEVAGMLKTMKDEAEKSLAEADATEADQDQNHKELVMAKNKQINGVHEPMLEKKERIADLSVALVDFRKDFAETKAALTTDEGFASDLDKSCRDAETSAQANAASRVQEMLAVQDTIKILNDDDALDTFKKTLPGAAFLQVDTSLAQRRKKALSIVREARSSRRSSSWGQSDLDLLELALKGGKADFSKVTAMIEKMLKLMNEEQVADDLSVANCETELAASADKVKVTGEKIKFLGTSTDEKQSSKDAIADDIKVITSTILQLDENVKEATSQRKEEHAINEQVLTSNNAAIDLLTKAKKRMDAFYNPPAHPKTGLIVLPGWNGAEPSTPGSFVQISAHTQLSSGNKKESNQIVAMLDHLIADLKKEVIASEETEKYAQQDYEKMIADSETRRADSAKSLVEKESLDAEAESQLFDLKRSLQSKKQQKADAEKYASAIHVQCDFITSNYDARKSARETETKNLKDTQATLAGAVGTGSTFEGSLYSFVQKDHKVLRGSN